MDHGLFEYSPIEGRPAPALPEGKRVAVWFGINVEHFAFGRPGLSLADFTAQLVPDPLNYGWRDYGPRVGIWRLARIFAAAGVPVTAVLNSEVCDHYPQIVEAGVEAGWAWVAHGANNSTWQTGMEPEEERGYIDAVATRIEQATGGRPRGWLGPALTASMNTNRLLAELGFEYVLDWANDDQPYDLEVEEGRLLALPYSSEINDIPIFHLHHGRGEDFERALLDQVEVLASEGADGPRALGVGLHPFLIGQAFRAKYLARALEQLRGRDDVWLTTADELSAWFATATAASEA
jgi:peptidoglycan/xylan/chitin deacetylase (PgdA/CDA1 family)